MQEEFTENKMPRITQKELTGRLGFILLGFFTFYLVEPIRQAISIINPTTNIIIGILGLLATLYFFDF